MERDSLYNKLLEPETLKAPPTEIMGLLAKLQAVEQALMFLYDINEFSNHNQRESIDD